MASKLNEYFHRHSDFEARGHTSSCCLPPAPLGFGQSDKFRPSNRQSFYLASKPNHRGYRARIPVAVAKRKLIAHDAIHGQSPADLEQTSSLARAPVAYKRLHCGPIIALRDQINHHLATAGYLLLAVQLLPSSPSSAVW